MKISHPPKTSILNPDSGTTDEDHTSDTQEQDKSHIYTYTLVDTRIIGLTFLFIHKSVTDPHAVVTPVPPDSGSVVPTTCSYVVL